MLKRMKTRWITGVISLALLGGVAVTATACGAEDKETVWDAEDEKELDPKLEETGNLSESNEQDYSGLAARIDEGAVAYLEAMKAGDIETMLSMMDPESEIYEKLSGIKEYETGKEFIHALYGDIVYEFEEDCDTEYSISHAIESGWDDFYLDMYTGIPNTTYLTQYLTVPGVVFQDGELIPEGYEVTSNEEALQIIRSVAEWLPRMDTVIQVNLQEDGGFYFDLTGPFFCMNDLDFESGADFLPKYLSEKIHGGVIVGESDKLFEENQEEWTQILSLLKQKDFDGLLALANGDPDKYIKKAFSKQTLYRTPEELTGEQRAFYDSYVERMEVYISERTYAESHNCLITVMVIAPAISLDDQEMEWYAENRIMEDRTDHRFGRDGEDGLINSMKKLLSLLEDGIEYAEKKY